METVYFDVGGTRYRVSRSLIETYPDTMLARLVSDTWQEDPEKEIFVDRDGTRFRYVLDYMRHQKVSLPVTVTKRALLEELEYLGFENVPAEAIDTTYCSNFEAVKHVAKLSKQTMAEVKGYEDAIADLKTGIERLHDEIFHCVLASQLIQHYTATGELSKDYKDDATIKSRKVFKATKADLLSKHLSSYGFKCTIEKWWKITFTLSELSCREVDPNIERTS